MNESVRTYPAIMHDPTTTIPVIIPASDYADAVRVAAEETGPGQLWYGYSVVILDRPTGQDDGSDQCEDCGWERRHCACH